MRIPILDLQPEIQEHWDEFNAAFKEVMTSGHFILGPSVTAFEKEAAAYLGVKHAVGVNSGTDALVIALKAIGIGPGSEVITTPFTFFATSESISAHGGTPVFTDIDPATLNLDTAKLESLITPRTKAIIPVHLFGLPCIMGPILEVAKNRGLRVIEDVAQAMGAETLGKKVGSLGDLGCYSFFPSKNLGGYGDGGLITTNDDALAETCRMLRSHGSRKKYMNETVGYNSRLDELQAALLRVKLRHLDKANEGRRAAAARYDRLLKAVPGVTVTACPANAKPVYHQYTIRVPAGRRDFLVEELGRKGIGTMVYYPKPLHRLPVYEKLKLPARPATEKASAEVISLPIWPKIGESVQKEVVQAIGEILSSKGKAQELAA